MDKFGPKNQNCQLKLKYGIGTNSNMQNSLVMFTFSVFNWKYFAGQISWKYLDWKYQFDANLVQKIKIVCLSWNLVPRLIWICRIQWWVLFTLSFFWLGIPFWGKFYPWSWSLVPRNFKYAEFISCWLFSNFDQIYSFYVNLVQKIKIVCLSWNLVCRLIWICRV